MADKKYLPNERTSLIDEILRRNSALEQRVRDLERELANQDAPAPLPRIDPTTYPTPYEGQRAIDVSDEQHTWYSNGQWRKGGPPTYAIKVFADWQNVRTGNGRFAWLIPEDVGGRTLINVEMYVTTVSSSGIIQVQLRKNTADDMLSTRVEIDASEKHSKDATTQYVINTSNAGVVWGDQISIDVDAAGTNARGLGLEVQFG